MHCMQYLATLPVKADLRVELVSGTIRFFKAKVAVYATFTPHEKNQIQIHTIQPASEEDIPLWIIKIAIEVCNTGFLATERDEIDPEILWVLLPVSVGFQIRGIWMISLYAPEDLPKDMVDGILTVVSFVGTLMSRKETDLALIASAEKYQRVADYTYDWEFWITTDNQFTYCSPSCLRVSGYTREEFLQEPDLLQKIVHPDDLPLYFKHREEAHHEIISSDSWSIEFRIIRKDGEVRWIHHICLPIFNRDGTYLGQRGSNRDISDKKYAERSLHEYQLHLEEIVRDRTVALETEITERKRVQQWFEHLFHNNPALMALSIMPDRKFTDLNNAFLKKLGYTRDELLGKTPIDMNLYVNLEQPGIISELLKSSSFISNIDLQIRCKNGGIIDVLLSGEIISGQGNQYFLTVMVDITKQKLAEKKIKQINQRLTLAADAANFGVWEFDLIRNHLDWDDWMLRQYGIHQDDFKGTYDDWYDRIYSEDEARVKEEVDLAIRGEKQLNTEFRIQNSGAELRYLKVNAIVVTDQKNRPIRMTGISYDITSQKNYEWEITQYAEQLSAQNLSLEELSDELSRLNQELDEKVRERTEEISHLLTVKTDLITQIGHDLKTPLTSVFALIPHIKKKVTDPHLQKLLDVVILDSKRMNQIINNILTLSTMESKTPDELFGETAVAKIVDRVISAEHLFIQQRNLRIFNHIPPSLVVRMS
ncbi:MAG TPA: PAS domain-containing protein, partial [Methanospirillum sp.]|uniref:PAS domain-containing protein n=1 Tax=Methanospirillum sp. TaxID=45200 RepID=UPI002B950E64